VAVIHNCDWRALPVTECDALIVDAPYSERTHAGHDSAAVAENEAILRPDIRDNRVRLANGLTPVRRRIDYAAWTPHEVREFVTAWSSRTRGWFVSITDHVLAPTWEESLRSVGRYVFQPLACVEPGSRVRLSGDGPSNWTVLAVVARPRTRAFQSWGTLPGAYVVPLGMGDGKRRSVVGGKPLWLMSQLVEHYSRPGDLVCDPCCGAGTTLVAALRSGRRAVGGDVSAEHAELARLWTANPHLSAPGLPKPDDAAQPGLFT
jgi:hypothetical protein